MLQRPVNLIQLSDLHLYAQSDRRLMGIDTQQSFADVVEMMCTREKDIDHIIVTGDISQDDTLESYSYCHDILSSLNIPFSWLKGNHDGLADLGSKHFPRCFPDRLLLNRWAVLLLNTDAPGEVHGELSCDELDYLESLLADFKERPVMIAMHHPPVSVNSHWLDEISLRDGGRFMRLLEKYPQVQSIIHGHTHQDLDGIHKGLRILGVPSTCVQFLPEAEEFTVDHLQPGYRRLRLYPDGGIKTEVCRLPEHAWLPDPTQSGY